jgi:hypothetical protein
MADDKRGIAQTGDGQTSCDIHKVNPRDVVFRRGTVDNQGVTSDVQDGATRKFQRDAGVKAEDSPKRSGWFR